MAWMRMMGADSVAYHRATVIDRADDHPGAALELLHRRGASRRWRGVAAARPGSASTATSLPEHYEDMFGPGGARDPITGQRLAATKRPGLELVVSAHKSVAELGRDRPGRGHARHPRRRDRRHPRLPRAAHPGPGRPPGPGRHPDADVGAGLRRHPPRHLAGGGPVPARPRADRQRWSRCSTTGAGGRPPTPRCGASTCTPPPPTAGSARRRWRSSWATGSCADDGPSGRLGHWAIAGIPDEAMAIHSKRSDEIDDALGAGVGRLLPGTGHRRPPHPHRQAPRAGRGPREPVAGRADRARPHHRRRSTPPSTSKGTVRITGDLDDRGVGSPGREAARARRPARRGQGVLPPRRGRRRRPAPVRSRPERARCIWSTGCSPIPRRSSSTDVPGRDAGVRARLCDRHRTSHRREGPATATSSTPPRSIPTDRGRRRDALHRTRSAASS